MLSSIQKYWYFSYFSTKTYVVGTHWKRLSKALLMSTHNICFHGEIRKIFTWYPLLSRPMHGWLNHASFCPFVCPRTFVHTSIHPSVHPKWSLHTVNVGGWVVRRCHVSFVTPGVQLILADSWARPAILVAGKGREVMFLFLLFLHFHSCFSFFPVPPFYLFCYLFCLFSPFLWETTQNDPQGLTCR